MSFRLMMWSSTSRSMCSAVSTIRFPCFRALMRQAALACADACHPACVPQFRFTFNPIRSSPHGHLPMCCGSWLTNFIHRPHSNRGDGGGAARQRPRQSGLRQTHGGAQAAAFPQGPDQEGLHNRKQKRLSRSHFLTSISFFARLLVARLQPAVLLTSYFSPTPRVQSHLVGIRGPRSCGERDEPQKTTFRACRRAWNIT